MNNKLDYYNLEDLKVLDNLPNSDISDISGSTCKDDGQYKLTETLDKNENLSNKYQNIKIRFAAPESSGICLMNVANINIDMTCQNTEKFYESKIYLERQLVQDEDGKELFLINSYESANTLECGVGVKTGSLFTGNTTDETGVDINKIFQKKSSDGLSAGAIAGIVIACVVAVAAIGVAIVLAKKKFFQAKGKLLSIIIRI